MWWKKTRLSAAAITAREAQEEKDLGVRRGSWKLFWGDFVAHISAGKCVWRLGDRARRSGDRCLFYRLNRSETLGTELELWRGHRGLPRSLFTAQSRGPGSSRPPTLQLLTAGQRRPKAWADIRADAAEPGLNQQQDCTANGIIPHKLCKPFLPQEVLAHGNTWAAWEPTDEKNSWIITIFNFLPQCLVTGYLAVMSDERWWPSGVANAGQLLGHRLQDGSHIELDSRRGRHDNRPPGSGSLKWQLVHLVLVNA